MCVNPTMKRFYTILSRDQIRYDRISGRTKTDMVIKSLFLFLLPIIINSCAGTGELRKLEFKDDSFNGLNVYGVLDKNISSKNFGGFWFVFENTKDQWSTVENISLSFRGDSAAKYIKALDKQKLLLWGNAVIQNQLLQQSGIAQLQSALFKAGTSVTGISFDQNALLDFATSKEEDAYPDDHLYAQNLILPPNFSLERWILFESSHHDNIPYSTTLRMEFDVNGEHQQADFTFRPESDRYNHFIWYDPRRKESLTLYLGLSAGSVIPVGTFADQANKQRYFIDSFGIQSYLTLFTNLGLNFSLDYQSFQSRAKLPLNADSISLFYTDLEFSNWQNYSLFISPRFVLPVNLKLDLFAELTAGVVLSLTPIVIIKTAGLEVAEIESKSSLSPAAGFALGTRFNLSDHICLDLKGEYIPFLKPKFTYQTEDNQKKEFRQDMSHVKIKAGLYWAL